MRKEYLILSLLIPGPHALGKELDVFLKLAIDDLKDLFHGFNTYDAYNAQKFQMCAAILWSNQISPHMAICLDGAPVGIKHVHVVLMILLHKD